jgi:hypothetical protein
MLAVGCCCVLHAVLILQVLFVRCFMLLPIRLLYQAALVPVLRQCTGRDVGAARRSKTIFSGAPSTTQAAICAGAQFLAVAVGAFAKKAQCAEASSSPAGPATACRTQ